MISRCALLIIISVIVLFLVIFANINATESMCVQKDYGPVTMVPMSNYVDANMALVHSTSLGPAPLGNPHYWVQSHSPITQGQWGLYQQRPLQLSETQRPAGCTLTSNNIANSFPTY